MKISIAGVDFSVVRQRAVLAQVRKFWQTKNLRPRQLLVVTPNPEMVVRAQKDEYFRQVLNSADIAVADGVGILWASYYLRQLNLLRKKRLVHVCGCKLRIKDKVQRVLEEGLVFLLALRQIILRPQVLKQVLPERVSGADLFPAVLRLAARECQKVFLLGGEKGVALKLKAKLLREMPRLEVVGVSAARAKRSSAVRRRIQRSGAQVLFVAFGAPKQEVWLARNLPKLKGVNFGMGVGGSFDFYVGRVPRAPQFLRRRGLEWFWRLLCQPLRWRRIWRATFGFLRLIWLKGRQI